MQDFRRLGTGASGLGNCGNTCYLNAIIQALVHCPPMNAFLDAGNYRVRLKRDQREAGSLLVEFDKVRILLWLRDHSVMPKGFVASLLTMVKQNGMIEFVEGNQCDAHEFLVFLFDAFHTAISRQVDMVVAGSPKTDRDKLAKKCYTHLKNQYNSQWSEFIQMFSIISFDAISCPESGVSLSTSVDCSSVLSIPLCDNAPTLHALLDRYTASELMCGENAWHDEDNGGYRDVNRCSSFWSLPDVFIVHLVRWGMDLRKNRSIIDFPIAELDMSKYVQGYRPDDYKYRLSAVCYHHGSPAGGHYSACAKSLRGGWLHYNDRVVREVSADAICSQDAYLLFYSKIK